MKVQGKLNMHIILKNVLMLFTKNIKISPCFSKLRLAKVGEFFRHNILTVLMFFLYFILKHMFVLRILL